MLAFYDSLSMISELSGLLTVNWLSFKNNLDQMQNFHFGTLQVGQRSLWEENIA